MVRDSHLRWGNPKIKRIKENLFFYVAFFVVVLPLKGKENLDLWINSELFPDGLSIENNLNVTWRNFRFGMNAGYNSSLDTGKPLELLPALAYEKDNRFKCFLFTHFDDGKLSHWESKINFRLKKVWVDLGIGKNNLVHLGFEYGTRTHFGFGAGIVKEKERKAELRAEIWKYWESLKIFTGFRKSGDDLVALISRPSTDRWALRLITIYDQNSTNFKFLQLSFGTRSRTGYYGLHFFDSWFFLQDTQIVGQDPILFPDKNPFRYIPAPVAWMIRGFGLRIQGNNFNGIKMKSIEVVKYLSADVYAELIGTDNGLRFIGIGLGKVTDNIKFVLRILYSDEVKKFKIAMKMRIFNL
jgi:hypothetical protein